MNNSVINRIISYIFAVILMISNQGTTFAQKLDATEFSERLAADTAGVLLDVRTEKEFSDGHIENALNINWNSDDFSERTRADIPKNKTIYVYCLSGGRSAKAAEQLEQQGYTVHELNGGILKWRSAGLPEEKPDASKSATGLSMAEFTQLISQQKVLVDFYAEWCAPCKMMEPFINEIAQSKKDIKVVRIDVDKNESLAQSLKIDALPVLHFYENGKLKWDHLGYINKKQLLKKIRR